MKQYKLTDEKQQPESSESMKDLMKPDSGSMETDDDKMKPDPRRRGDTMESMENNSGKGTMEGSYESEPEYDDDYEAKKPLRMRKSYRNRVVW